MTQIKNTTENLIRHSYGYDSQGRIVSFTSGSPGSANEEQTTVRYEGNDVILTKNSSVNGYSRLYRENGRFVRRLSGASAQVITDTTTYFYSGDKLSKWVVHSGFGGQLTISVDSVAYDAAGMPAALYLDERTGNGTVLGHVRTQFEYDSKPVTYTPNSFLSLAPGLDLVSEKRMLTKITQGAGVGNYTDHITPISFQNSYDSKGLPTQSLITSPSQNYAEAYTFVCQ